MTVDRSGTNRRVEHDVDIPINNPEIEPSNTPLPSGLTAIGMGGSNSPPSVLEVLQPTLEQALPLGGSSGKDEESSDPDEVVDVFDQMTKFSSQNAENASEIAGRWNASDIKGFLGFSPNANSLAEQTILLPLANRPNGVDISPGLYIITAPTSKGKSTFARALMASFALARNPSFYKDMFEARSLALRSSMSVMPSSFSPKEFSRTVIDIAGGQHDIAATTSGVVTAGPLFSDMRTFLDDTTTFFSAKGLGIRACAFDSIVLPMKAHVAFSQPAPALEKGARVEDFDFLLRLNDIALTRGVALFGVMNQDFVKNVEVYELAIEGILNVTSPSTGEMRARGVNGRRKFDVILPQVAVDVALEQMGYRRQLANSVADVQNAGVVRQSF